MVSTAQLSFSCPWPLARRSPRSVRLPVPPALSGVERSAPGPGRPSAPLGPSAAAGPGAAGSFSGTRCRGPPLRRNFSRGRGGCAGAGRRKGLPGRAGRGGGTRCCRGLAASFTFLSLVLRKFGFLSCRRSGPALPGPAEAGGEVSGGSAPPGPSRQRGPRGPGRRAGGGAGRGCGGEVYGGFEMILRLYLL